MLGLRQSDIIQAVSKSGITALSRKGDSKDLLTISDNSIETFEQSTFASLSARNTISLQSLDGKTINPDSYGSQDDEYSSQSEWIVIGQPDHAISETVVANNNWKRFVLIDHNSIDLDFDKQKRFAEIQMQRRLKSIKCSLENMQFCDLSLQFGSSTTPVHAMMFRIHEGFANRFPGLADLEKKPTAESRQLDVYGDVTVPAFSAIMNFVYGGQCEVAYENLVEIVTAVEYFGITALEDEITKMVKLVMIDAHLLPIIFQGDSDHPLHYVAWAKLLERISFVAKQGDYVALEIAEICMILSANGLAVQTEYQVFEMVMTWLHADFLTRNIHFNRILSCVRFHFMTTEELTKCQGEEDLLSSSQPIADVIALAYIARPFILENDISFLENFKLLPPRNLEVLQHFTALKDQQISETLKKENSYKVLFPVEEVEASPVRCGWGQQEVNNATIPRAKILDEATLEGLRDLTDDDVEYISFSHPALHVFGQKRLKGLSQSASRAPSSSKMASKQAHTATTLTGTKNRLSSPLSAVNNKNTERRSSFSDMTFNNNGSLVTQRGGKEAHRMLNQAYNRIYNQNLFSSSCF